MGLFDAISGSKYQNLMNETWGHLAPKPEKVYQGEMVFTLGQYGDITPIKAEFDELDDSPWFFEDMQEYICRKAKEHGTIYKFIGTYRKLKNGRGVFSGEITKIRT